MGMSFMQRKVAAPEQAPTPKEQEEPSAMEIEEDPNDSSSIVPEIASAVDMYSVKGVMIGRRAFGEMNPPVSTRYTKVLDSYNKKRSRTEASKEHISDDELLRRYQQYVKGNGDMGGQRPAPVGNLKDKVKKKSPGQGKRKRP